VIEVVPSFPDGRSARLRLRPPRALTARLFAVLAGAMWLVASAGWLAGNVFAPAFALLHSAIVAAALRCLWRSGDRDECITIGPQVVEVSRTAQAGVRAQAVFRAHPYWVRLGIEAEGERISLASSGRRVEVGNFLGPAERRELAGQLQVLLAAASRYR
jgi:uncharacterized membrane protein